MDDRKRQIAEAEQRKKEQAALLDSLLERIGEAIFARSDGLPEAATADFAEFAAYGRLCGEAAGAQDSIRAAEERMIRFRELEEGIESGDREAGVRARELANAHGRLGRLLLEEAGKPDGGPHDEFLAPFLGQADEMVSKVRSLEDRLSGLEQKEKGNVFAWIGKSAQTLVLKSFLGKAQENLDQLRRTVGERFSLRNSGSLFPETAATETLCGEIELARSELDAVSRDTAFLRDEKRAISDGFSADGGPLRYIQNLKNQIAGLQNELRSLYRRMGNEAAFPGDSSGGRAEVVASLLAPEDRGNVEAAVGMSRAVGDCETVIEKLKAAIAIDEEKAKIEKHRRAIQEKRDRIAQAERNIVELEGSIRDCEASIEKLRELL